MRRAHPFAAEQYGDDFYREHQTYRSSNYSQRTETFSVILRKVAQ